MDRFNKLGGGVKAVATVALVLAMTGALVLLAAEKPERGFLGVSVQRLDDGNREKLGVTHGVEVARVDKESAAAKAGIQEDDIIQSVNGEKVRDPLALAEIVRELAPGSSAKIGIWRAGKALELKAVLGKLERRERIFKLKGPFSGLFRSGPYLGVNIMDLEADLAAYFGVKAGEGVLVTDVGKETPAAKAGLKAGDIIVQLGGKAVRATGDIHEALSALKQGDGVEVTVVRHGKRETFKVQPDYERHRSLRVLGNDRDIGIEHLEFPEMDIQVPELPDLDIEAEIPDREEIVRHVHEKLDHAREKLEHVHERLPGARFRIEKRLRHVSENYWI